MADQPELNGHENYEIKAVATQLKQDASQPPIETTIFFPRADDKSLLPLLNIGEQIMLGEKMVSFLGNNDLQDIKVGKIVGFKTDLNGIRLSPIVSIEGEIVVLGPNDGISRCEVGTYYGNDGKIKYVPTDVINIKVDEEIKRKKPWFENLISAADTVREQIQNFKGSLGLLLVRAFTNRVRQDQIKDAVTALEVQLGFQKGNIAEYINKKRGVAPLVNNSVTLAGRYVVFSNNGTAVYCNLLEHVVDNKGLRESGWVPVQALIESMDENGKVVLIRGEKYCLPEGIIDGTFFHDLTEVENEIRAAQDYFFKRDREIVNVFISTIVNYSLEEQRRNTPRP
jgi:hypothetical protein